MINRNTTSVSPLNDYNSTAEFNSTEQTLEDELKDTVPTVDHFESNAKDARKNRERFAIKKSYSIEVSGYFISEGSIIFSSMRKNLLSS